jgi:uncharacterized membrane protein
MHAWHPLFVHFPLALLTGGVAVEVAGWLARRPSWRRVALGLLTAGVITAVPTVATGLLAYGRVDHSAAAHALMTTHRNLMLVAVGLFAVAVVWRWRLGDRPLRRPWGGLYALLVAAATGVLLLGSERGADLVLDHATGIPSTRLETILHDRHAGHTHHPAASGDDPVERVAPSGGERTNAGSGGTDPAAGTDSSASHDDSGRPQHEH